MKKNQKGITLVALVVTIVVLIILATVSINAVMGENGIIKKAELASEMQANAVASDEAAMDTLLEEYANALAEPPAPEVYEDEVLPTTPKLTEGMTKVKYNSTSGKWEKVEDDAEEWYDYSTSEKRWANVVLGDAEWNADGTLNESEPYTQLVWIPRYAYKITSQYHTSGSTAGGIDIVFVDTANKNGSTTYSTTYPDLTDDGTGMSDYVVHPAFNYGNNGEIPLSGFWMGKFESSHTGCDDTVASGQVAYTGNEVMTVRANVTSWRNIKIGNAFATCLAMNNANNPYGLSSDDTVVDPHMTKNSEWGAVAYLSQSTYGKNAEVWINNSSTYITGNAGNSASASSASGVTNAYNEGNGPQASTTGNVYGIYDMSGGNWERVAAYVNNGHGNITGNGGDLATCAAKYKDVYTAYDSNGAVTTTSGSDSQAKNYAGATPANGHYGDAVYETSSSGSDGAYSWYSDYSYFPHSYSPFFKRGGDYDFDSSAGVFYFNRYTGEATADVGFRVVVPVLK